MTALAPRPDVAAPGPWSFPRAAEFTLGSGLRVLAFERPGQLVAAVGLTMPVPLTAEPREREGVAGLWAGVLDQGTATHPGTSFADAVEDCGAELAVGHGFSALQLSLDAPVSRLGEALALMAEALSEPQLTDDDVDRERADTLAMMAQEDANSSDRADRALDTALFTPDSRMSRRRDGEPETLAAVTGADVRAFHDRFVGPRGATLVLAGELGDVRQLVEDTFGAWTHETASVPYTPARPAARSLVLVDRPGAVQADVRLGLMTTDRRDPAYADLQIAAYALGGAFMSRLNAVLREELGYTYGVRLGNTPFKQGGVAVIGGSFRTEVVVDTVSRIPGLIDVAATPLTDAEVADAQRYLNGVQPLQYATAAGVRSGAMALVAAGLEPAYVDAQRAALAAVTPETASAAATRFLRAADMSLVIVGDAGALAGPLREAGLDVQIVRDAR